MNPEIDSNKSRDDNAELELEFSPAGPRRGSGGRSRAPIVVLSIFVGLFILVLALVVVWRWRKSGAEAEQNAVPVVGVRVARAEKQAIAAQVSAVGTIFPREQATVSAKISAQIKQMAILKNRIVKAGEIIAVLESRDLQAQRAEADAVLNAARANERSVTTGTIPQTEAQDEKAVRDARARVANARATFERRQALYAQGGISKKDLETTQLDLATAESELRLAEQTKDLRTKSLNPNDRALAAAKVAEAVQHLATIDAQLSYATIRAPITGVVTDQFQYEGEFATAGAKLFNIADISEVIVKAPFADAVAAQLKLGNTAIVLPTDSAGEESRGQISLISRSSDPASRTVEVWVKLANGAGRLRANGAAAVTISTESRSEAIVVPTAAVTLESSNADEGTVMVVDEKSIAHEKTVTVGIRTKDKMEITKGLLGGETVVIEGNFSLADGTKVEIAKEKKEDEKQKQDER
jgi:multidrug efflux pump subunit AcrA (membrane-fusion protein)